MAPPPQRRVVTNRPFKSTDHADVRYGDSDFLGSASGVDMLWAVPGRARRTLLTPLERSHLRPLINASNGRGKPPLRRTEASPRAVPAADSAPPRAPHPSPGHEGATHRDGPPAEWPVARGRSAPNTLLHRPAELDSESILSYGRKMRERARSDANSRRTRVMHL